MVEEALAYVQGESLKANAALLTEAFKLPDHQVGGSMGTFLLLYVFAGSFPAYGLCYGRVGRGWAFAAWLCGFVTALLAAAAASFAIWPDTAGRAAALGEAAPFALLMPLAGVWSAKIVRRRLEKSR